MYETFNNGDPKLKSRKRILKEWKSLPSSRLYDFYAEKVRYPKGRRSFRNYMQNLCTKGYVKIIGEKRGRVYEIIEHPEVIQC